MRALLFRSLPAAAAVLCASAAFAQAPGLTIVSPAPGTRVIMGQPVTVVVSADPSVEIEGVLAESPLPALEPTADPNRFTLTVPLTVNPGTYTLTAVGSSATGLVQSVPLTISVERQFIPGTLTIEPSLLVFDGPGGPKQQIHVFGRYADGTVLDITRSVRTSFTSRQPAIATVDSTGLVSAVAPGQTAIFVEGDPVAQLNGPVLVRVGPAAPAGAAPVLTEVSPAAGLPGVEVTLTGTGFGAAQGTGSVQLGTRDADIRSWSDTQIVAAVAGGAATGVAEVTQNGAFSNSLPFVIDAPVIRSIAPVTLAPGVTLTVTGSGFGVPETGSVSLAGRPAAVASWTDSAIAVTVPDDVSLGAVTVRQGARTSNAASYVTIAPVLTGLSPAALGAGTPVTLTGTDFRAGQGSSVVTFGEIPAAVTSWSDTQIVLGAPAGLSPGEVHVRVGGRDSNGVPFTVAPPVLRTLSPPSGIVGTEVALAGTGFGNATGTVTFRGNAAAIVSWTDTRVVAVVPTGAKTGVVRLSNGDVASNTLRFTMPDPQIGTLAPPSGVVGTAITLDGTGFGTEAGIVNVHGREAAVQSWTDTHIVALVPQGARTGVVRVVTGGVASNGVAFTMPNPQIVSTDPTAGVVGTSVAIDGTEFGATPGTVTFQNKEAAVQSWTESRVVVTVPAGAHTGAVRVVSGGVASNPVTFTLPSPYLYYIDPPFGVVGTSVTIYGVDLGAAPGVLTFQGKEAAVQSWSESEIVATVPAGAHAGNVKVVVAGGVASNPYYFSLPDPQITEIVPPSAAVGAVVTLNGYGFGESPGTVAFRGKDAVIQSWSDSQIVAVVPAGARTGAVRVTTGGVTGDAFTFTVIP